jgi:ABC-type transport system involved in multi-copper enzyme maturation permease subunit
VSRATWVLVLQSFQRHWQVREMGWVALGLLSLVLIWDAAISHSAAGWGLENRRVRRTQITYRDYAEQLRPHGRYDALEAPEQAAKRTVNPLEHPAPLEPLRDSLTSLMLSIPQAVLLSEKFRGDWSFAHFVRSVMMGAYLSFVLPMFTLAYASGALGAERENRSLIWLMTRPMPRSLIYLAKFVGTLPWCLLFGFGGFAALCVAGGEPGRIAFRLFWPTALAGTIAFSALFHLIGSLFRRPIVVGLVYVFFFEFLVAILPGSMKLLSMTFYLRSLMYNAAVEAGYPGSLFEQSGPVSATAAWSVLASAAFGVTILGMILFSRSEYRDDV